jgi:hypothetical protein
MLLWQLFHKKPADVLHGAKVQYVNYDNGDRYLSVEGNLPA